MKDIASLKNLIAQNPSGLLELKPSLSIPEYRNNYGFGLKKTFTIFESEKTHHSGNDHFTFPGKTMETLFTVQEESSGDLLVAFIVETIKKDRVYVHLILSDEAYKKILNDKDQHVLKVHQVYTRFWEDHIALNTETT